MIASPSRRQLLNGIAASAMLAAVGSPGVALAADPAPMEALNIQIRDLRDRVARELAARLTAGKLFRPDGYLYSVDAAQLMICFAQLGDLERYKLLYGHCTRNLIRDDHSDPYTKGFVPWRFKAGEKPDASGTTEALRVAKGLWLGASAFNRPADIELARTVLGGYENHSATDQGIWFIRNYFSFGSRVFANNSYLVDYDPDFIFEIGQSLKDEKLSKLAADTLGAVRKCVTPVGLFYDLIQPELRTLYPELAIEAFSPNDVVGLFNCCTTALGVAKQAPELARSVLRFGLDRRHDLKRYYYGRNGWSVNPDQAAVCEYTSLARLAVALGDMDAAKLLVNDGLPQWLWMAEHTDTADAFLLTEILQTTIALTPSVAKS